MKTNVQRRQAAGVRRATESGPTLLKEALNDLSSALRKVEQMHMQTRRGLHVKADKEGVVLQELNKAKDAIYQANSIITGLYQSI